MVQRNLNAATDSMNTAMQRMSTGLRINTAADDAAGMAVSAGLERQIRGSVVAQSNGQMGSSMLTVAEGSLGVIQSNLLRIRDLVEQAGNDTYGTEAREGIKSEVEARLNEIDRLSKVADFNGIKLSDGSIAADVRIQIGIDGDANNAIMIPQTVFGDAQCSTLGLFAGNTGQQNFLDAIDTSATAVANLALIDTALTNIVERKTQIGAVQNRITSAVDGLKIQETNLTSSNSAIKDADIAVESSNFVRSQILQQASASLLTQANQTPSIALSLI